MNETIKTEVSVNPPVIVIGMIDWERELNAETLAKLRALEGVFAVWYIAHVADELNVIIQFKSDPKRSLESFEKQLKPYLVIFDLYSPVEIPEE